MAVDKSTGCVLIHGYTGTTWALESLGERLAELGIRVEIPLLPGHGTRPEDLDSVSWQDWVACVQDAIRSLKTSCDELFLIGLSMGGTIALLLAQESDARGVICLSAPINMKQWLRPILPVIRPFIREWKKKRDPAVHEQFIETGYDRYTLSSLTEFLKLLKESRKRLQTVTCPILIMHAREDRTVPSKNAERIYRSVHSEVKELYFLDHPAHMITRGENQPCVENKVLDFIQKLSIQSIDG